VIDAGSVEGVSIGQHVFAFDSIAVGVVTGLDTHNATVELYSAPGRETTGTATGNNVAVTLIGRGGGEYEVHLPRDVHFDIGESIAYQSTTSAILAQIEKITTDPRDPFQRLLAKAPVNLNALKWVIVK
jgi:cell shape-determining protein MreC